MRGFDVVAYGDFVDPLRLDPLFFMDKSEVESETVLKELMKVAKLPDDLLGAYKLAVADGDAQGFWDAFERLSEQDKGSRSGDVESRLPELIKVLGRKGGGVAKVGSIGFLFHASSESQADALQSELKSHFEMLALSTVGASRIGIDEEKDLHDVAFWPCAVERTGMFPTDLMRADMHIWPMRGSYNLKWRKVGNWINGYILHMCQTAWNRGQKRVLEPRLLYLSDRQGDRLDMSDWPRKARNLVQKRVEQEWGTKNYPVEPSLVLWFHADPLGEKGFFAKIVLEVQTLLEKFDAPIIRESTTVDLSGCFWGLKNAEFPDNATILKIMHNRIKESDLIKVKKVADLFKELRELWIIAGNNVSEESVKKIFPTLTIK
jgi:hypothetical protein